MRNRISRSAAALTVATLLTLGACDDDPEIVAPVTMPDVALDVTSLAFGEVDLQLGADGPRTVRVSNAGNATLSVASTTLSGTDAAAFSITDGGGAFMLEGGATRDITVAFSPASQGGKSASLVIASDDPDEASVSVALSGTGTLFQFTQVDRMGIPALNTVFNHPTAVAGFDKTAYNVAGPADDLASYRGLFETVLGAVANADPEGTAALLLPDALPVSLGASPTAFAMLTGRELADDAVDVALTVVVGVDGLQTDNVDANDAAFLGQFPYLAPAN